MVGTDAAAAAVEQLDGAELEGRALSVCLARPGDA
jgi:hypothetical protein